jgi:cation diffusion facilitator family transporter
MKVHSLRDHRHDHDTALASGASERRTLWVVGLTASMMVAELVAGYVTGSMALLADGWHMATHAGALGLSALAYWYARTRAASGAFSFGTGKVYALAGYTSAVALAVVALWMIVESTLRLASPHDVDFAEALPIAIAGLGVNLLSVLLLGVGHGHDHGHDHEHDHADDHDHDHPHDHAHPHAEAPARPPTHGHGHGDHNLRAAYMHVLADALTSVLAIAALLCGHYAGWWFLDPAMGIVGGLVILRWSVHLCGGAARQLLDAVPSAEHARRLQTELEGIDDVRVADLHLWDIGPGRRGCIVSLVTAEPRDTAFYRERILAAMQLAHLTVEIHKCGHGHEGRDGHDTALS